MYRIDENTYIDDSLVTCAEYQLFIDEMREQKKFFQPDHWTSWQFPAGQAHTPILGVRPSDAKAFCEWLSGRKEGEWCFRLPTADESAQYPIQKQDVQFNGYWTLDKDGHSFAWIGSVPVNPRGIDFFHIFARNFARTSANAIDNPIFIEIDHIRTNAATSALDRAITSALDRASASASAHDLVLDFAIDYARNFVNAIARTRASDLGRALDHNFDRALNIDRTLVITPVLDLNRAPGLNRIIDLNRALYHARDFILSIWIDLITLQERIAGRSPAFEGIRLVKERKPE